VIAASSGEETAKMSVLVVETYVVRAERRDDYDPALLEFLDFKGRNPELFLGLVSWRLWKQEYGGVSDMYVEMWEYESLTEMERVSDRIFADEGMKKISRGFHQLVEPATFTAAIWSPVA
jgi:hypothetical protein